MKHLFTFITLVVLCHGVCAQRLHTSYVRRADSIRIGTGARDFLPGNHKGYTLILPDSTQKVQGVLISLEDDRFDLDNPKQQIHPEATQKGLVVLYISTGVPVDLFFNNASLHYVDTTLAHLFSQYALTGKPVWFLGVGLAGHRALRYILHHRKTTLRDRLPIRGAVLCETVLDWVRQWYEEKKGVRDNFAPSAVFEGKMITYLLEKHLRGTPKNRLEAYLAFSPYSYFDERNRNLAVYKDLAIRAYSEPATYYWMEERRKGMLDTNFPDMVGVINELKLAGNQRSELILFHQDKANKDRRNPFYTWSLVNKVELVEWILTQLQSK